MKFMKRAFLPPRTLMTGILGGVCSIQPNRKYPNAKLTTTHFCVLFILSAIPHKVNPQTIFSHFLSALFRTERLMTDRQSF